MSLHEVQRPRVVEVLHLDGHLLRLAVVFDGDRGGSFGERTDKALPRDADDAGRGAAIDRLVGRVGEVLAQRGHDQLPALVQTLQVELLRKDVELRRLGEGLTDSQGDDDDGQVTDSFVLHRKPLLARSEEGGKTDFTRRLTLRLQGGINHSKKKRGCVVSEPDAAAFVGRRADQT